MAHSQGGLLTKLYIHGGGVDNIRRLVAMGGNFHGTDFGGLAPKLAPFILRHPKFSRAIASTSALQMLVDSEFFTGIAHVPDTDPRVVYTSIYTPADRIVTPNTSSILESVNGADVVNINLQKAYPDFAPGVHTLMPRNPLVAELTQWGLERPSEADPGV